MLVISSHMQHIRSDQFGVSALRTCDMLSLSYANVAH